MTASKSLTFPKGWIPAGSHPKSYDMSTCTDAKHSGTKCARIHSIKDKIDGFGTIMQSLNASGYRGQRVKLSAYIKSENVEDWAGVWMRVDAGKKIVSFDNMQDRAIKGNTDWTKYEVVLDVSKESTNISFGVLLSGTGTVWLDDFEFVPVAKETRTTGDLNRSCGIRYQTDRATNLDFSEGLRSENQDPSISATPKGWFKQVSAGGKIAIGLDEPSIKGEATSAFIQSTDNAHGALLQALLADDYVGKRVKLSAQVKTSSVKGTTGLFYRTDAGQNLSVTYDHMEDRMITGTTDWTEHDCVIDIPPGTDNIYFGGVLYGDGTVWFKDFKLEVVAQDVPTTGSHGSFKQKKAKKTTNSGASTKNVNSLPVNLSFDDGANTTTGGARGLPIGWLASGSDPDKFKMSLDKRTVLGSSKCALIEAKDDTEQGFGTLMQNVNADFCKNKRMRLSGHIKTEEADWAALWMRIDGQDGEVLGFDNMQQNPIKETTDWNYYECVLDVPENAKVVAFGILLSGKGKAWLTKVALEEVAQDVETTDIKSILTEHKQPANLRFEED